MYKQILTFFLCFAIYVVGYSQNSSSDISDLQNKYSNYFKLDQETIFTQLDKNQFFVGESLWFKTYVYSNSKQVPYLMTTDLYVGIYNWNGKLIEKKLYNVNDAMTYGNFEITDKYVPGTYYIKSTTSWMNNFDDDRSDVQEFKVIGETSKDTETQIDSDYDFQLLPEGGHLVADLDNSIGFKIVDAMGKHAIIKSGKVLDSNHHVITTFVSNSLGLGKFNLLAKNKETYHIEATLDNDTVITQTLPTAELKGIALSINNLNDKLLYISIKTNEATLLSLKDKKYHILIHRDGLLTTYDFKFEPNTYDYLLPINRTDLHPGINIITLMGPDQKPICERLIYNGLNKLIDKVSVTAIKKLDDSTQVILKSSNATGNKNISISALPSSNLNYDSDHNIFSAFIFQPYIKGTIEDVNSYFEDTSRKSTFNLDLLLMTQGWSKYNWHSIFNNPQQPHYNFETGFQIRGKVTEDKNKKYSEVVLFSQMDGLLLNTALDGNNTFSFENLYLSDSTTVSFSLKSPKGELIDPKLYYNVYPVYKADSIKVDIFQKRNQTKISTPEDYNSLIYDNTTMLDLITITQEVDTTKNKVLFGRSGGKFISLNEFYNDFSPIINVIRDNGFDVRIDQGVPIIKSRRKLRLKGGDTPAVYIDNILISSDNYDVLLTLRVSDFEEVYISRLPSITTGASGTINLFTKKGGFNSHARSRENFNKSVIDFGFSTSKEYYAPNYDPTQWQLISKYGVLNWIPNVKMSSNGEFVFKIPNYFHGKVTLYINGMSETGELISTIETIDTRNSSQ